MNLIDRIKQGLRELARGQSQQFEAGPAGADRAKRADRACGFRQRSELDPAVTSPRRVPLGLDATLPSPSAISTRLKRAVLSKARRASRPRDAAAIWGHVLSPAPAVTSPFDSSTSDPPHLLGGTDLTGAAQADPHRAIATAPQLIFSAEATPPTQQDLAIRAHTIWDAPPPSTPSPFGAADSLWSPSPSLLDGAPSFAADDASAPATQRACFWGC